MGPIDGLEAAAPVVGELQSAGVNLLIVPKGAVRDVATALLPTTLLGVHLSASTSLGGAPDHKLLIGTPAEAAALGADLVSIQVNFGIAQEGAMLQDLGSVVDQCRSVGLPLLCMAYVKRSGGGTPEEIRHACRASADLGADIVKTSYPGSEAELARLVRSTPVPVLLGGGEKSGSTDDLMRRVSEVVRAGGRGICIGRNLFQRQPIGPLARRISAILEGRPDPAPS
ncbi:MAG: fructose-bisphosphate aldolase [Thermoplasmata archaeon]|nr:fructose-bisphosphate aldolase [Thermoplasmata archaeon]MCI4359484.1 fructose-bisphosphate aldolase [Thermoplasmata archaeon]